MGEAEAGEGGRGGGGRKEVKVTPQDPPASSAWVSLKMSAGLEFGGEEEEGEGGSGREGNAAQDPPHSPSDMAPGQQLSLRSQNTMRQMRIDLKATTGQGNALL